MNLWLLKCVSLSLFLSNFICVFDSCSALCFTSIHMYQCVHNVFRNKELEERLTTQLAIATIATLNQNNSPISFTMNLFWSRHTIAACLWREKILWIRYGFRSFAFFSLWSIHCCDIVEGECFPLKFSHSNRYRRRAQKTTLYMCNQTVCARECVWMCRWPVHKRKKNAFFHFLLTFKINGCMLVCR